MARISLTDGSGHWYDSAKAVDFDEDVWFDGSNQISKATGSQWEHETLRYTRGGRWVLRSYSQWQGTSTSHDEIDEGRAIDWLIEQGCDLDELPATVKKRVRAKVEQAEI